MSRKRKKPVTAKERARRAQASAIDADVEAAARSYQSALPKTLRRDLGDTIAGLRGMQEAVAEMAYGAPHDVAAATRAQEGAMERLTAAVASGAISDSDAASLLRMMGSGAVEYGGEHRGGGAPPAPAGDARITVMHDPDAPDGGAIHLYDNDGNPVPLTTLGFGTGEPWEAPMPDDPPPLTPPGCDPDAYTRAPSLWKAPHPAQVPDIRARLLTTVQGAEAHRGTAAAIRMQQGTLVPATGSMDDAATILHAQEAQRLAGAALWMVSRDMVRMAVRRAWRPIRHPLTLDRVPGWKAGRQHGFMMFAEPIAAYTEQGPPGMDPIMPIVAISWGPWRADFAPTTGIPVRRDIAQRMPGTGAAWEERNGITNKGELRESHYLFAHPGTTPDDDPFLWVTLWSVSGAYARQVGRNVQTVYSDAKVSWENELSFAPNSDYELPEPAGTSGVCNAALRMIHAIFLLTTQADAAPTARPVTREERVERKAQRARRDRRQGVEDGGGVTVFHVHPGERPAAAGRPAGGGGKKWTLKWRVEVPERDRWHCMNPHLHQAGECTHAYITVPDHFRGPANAPVKPKVGLVDKPPRE